MEFKNIRVDTSNIGEVNNLVKWLIKNKLYHSWEEEMKFDEKNVRNNTDFFERTNSFYTPEAAEEFVLIEDEPGAILFGVLNEPGPYKIEHGDQLFVNGEWVFIQSRGLKPKLVALKKGPPVREKTGDESAFDL